MVWRATPKLRIRRAADMNPSINARTTIGAYGDHLNAGISKRKLPKTDLFKLIVLQVHCTLIYLMRYKC